MTTLGVDSFLILILLIGKQRCIVVKWLTYFVIK